jgi:hypothetical protein
MVKDPYELDNLLLLSTSASGAKGYTQSQVEALASGLQSRLRALKAQ